MRPPRPKRGALARLRYSPKFLPGQTLRASQLRPTPEKERPRRFSRGPDRKHREGIIAGKHLKFGVLPKG